MSAATFEHNIGLFIQEISKINPAASAQLSAALPDLEEERKDKHALWNELLASATAPPSNDT